MESNSIIARMFKRQAADLLRNELAHMPAVALLGPRQVGKTTLALEVAQERPSLYLDLESERDRAKLAEPELYLSQHQDKLVIFDEVHRTPALFPVLRGLIDRARRDGRRQGLYLLLGSASLDLLQQSGETLAGRIAYLELGPLNTVETGVGTTDALWLRGGFPDSFTAPDDARSLRWRQNFIRTYLERDIPQLGPRIAAETLRRFWTMLAHQQGGLLNVAQLARNLGVDAKTAHSYIDLLCDLLLVRRLQPWHANLGKRLVYKKRVAVSALGLGLRELKRTQDEDDRAGLTLQMKNRLDMLEMAQGYEVAEDESKTLDTQDTRAGELGSAGAAELNHLSATQQWIMEARACLTI